LLSLNVQIFTSSGVFGFIPNDGYRELIELNAAVGVTIFCKIGPLESSKDSSLVVGGWSVFDFVLIRD